jgi:hypothetical protein
VGWRSGRGVRQIHRVFQEQHQVLNLVRNEAGLTQVPGFRRYAVDSSLANDKLAFGGGWGFFDRTPDVFRVFATNFGFANPAKDEPFFYETPRQSMFAINHGRKTEPSLGYQEVQRATFSTFHHPLVRDFQAELAEYGPAGLMNRLTQALPVADNRYYDNYYYNYYGYLYLGYHIAGDSQAWWTTQRIFQADQEPGLKTVITPYPLPTVEFGYGTSFGIYNWEPSVICRSRTARRPS